MSESTPSTRRDAFQPVATTATKPQRETASPCRHMPAVTTIERTMYQIIQCDLQGRFIAVVAGLGRRAQDAAMSRATAYRHCKALRQSDKSHIYAVIQA